MTLRWIEAGDHDTAIAAIAAKHDLVRFLEGAGNSQDQVDHWLSYSSEMAALEGETLAAVIEVEAIMGRMQGNDRFTPKSGHYLDVIST